MLSFKELKHLIMIKHLIHSRGLQHLKECLII